MTVMLSRDKKVTDEYPDLQQSETYNVIGIEADNFRILNDQGHPYLYPADIFIIVNAAEPSYWLVQYGEEGEKYAYPAALNEAGFFEDFFDDDPDAQRTLAVYIASLQSVA